MNLHDAKNLIKRHFGQFYVYILKRPDGSPFYVGKGNCKGFRIEEHGKEALSNKGRNKHKINTIRKIWEEGDQIDYDFSIFTYNEEEAFDKEMELVNFYGRSHLSSGILTNLTDGGEGVSGFICSKQSRIEKSKRLKGKPVPLAFTMKGRHHKEESKIKTARSCIGRPSAMEGRHHKEESKEKMRITRKKNGHVKHSEEALAKMRKPRSEECKVNMRKRWERWRAMQQIIIRQEAPCRLQS